MDPELELFDADVYVQLGSTELVVEVAMENKKRELERVKQQLETAFDAIWIVCRNEVARDGKRKRLEDNGLMEDRVTFWTFRDIPEVRVDRQAI